MIDPDQLAKMKIVAPARPGSVLGSSRATIPALKRMAVEHILENWNQLPEQRLGQFIGNALTTAGYDINSIFLLEDDFLIELMQRFVADQKAGYRDRDCPDSRA